MSRLSMSTLETATGKTAEIMNGIKKAIGMVPNAYATIATHSPAGLQAMLAVDQALTTGSLSKQELEAIKLLVSESGGCDYCVAAHTMIGKMAGLSAEAIRAIRFGQPSGNAKLDALLAFLGKLNTQKGTLDAAGFNAVREAGYTEQQIVEALLAVSVITFTNLVNRANNTTLDFPTAN
ncbi:MAG: carboxymuconolactone decarboxylase family protein [Pseudomonadota bacterium]